MGDTGSLFCGAWYGGAAILYIHDGPPGAVYAVVLVAMPWLSDVLLTMAWRLKEGQRLLDAHKEHLYQLALRRGASHAYAATSLSAQTLVCAVLAFVFRSSATSELLALSAAAVFALIIHWRARRMVAVRA